MAKIAMNPKLDSHFRNAEKWREEMEVLRMIVLDCGLTEELKWYQPCYTLQERNIVLIHGFKEYCALLFFKGVLMRDPRGILIRQTENVQAGRQIRFTNVREIVKLKSVLKAYIKEAVRVEKTGLKVKLKKEINIPPELQTRLDSTPALRSAFHSLTPGRQRAYAFYFSAPKQSITRESRIEKCIPRILKGKGLNDE